jgi:hypothetical protein
MEADRGFPQAATAHDAFWDFISLMPESTHMMMWAMSDRTIPRSLLTMQGFGIGQADVRPGGCVKGAVIGRIVGHFVGHGGSTPIVAK